jgi:hypothetical protein
MLSLFPFQCALRIGPELLPAWPGDRRGLRLPIVTLEARHDLQKQMHSTASLYVLLPAVSLLVCIHYSVTFAVMKYQDIIEEDEDELVMDPTSAGADVGVLNSSTIKWHRRTPPIHE